MSEVDIVVRSCGSKKRYPTEGSANSTAIQCWYDRKIRLRAYACEICGGWHLTKSGAAPRMREGWRLPKLSEREQNIRRKQERRRR